MKHIICQLCWSSCKSIPKKTSHGTWTCNLSKFWTLSFKRLLSPFSPWIFRLIGRKAGSRLLLVTASLNEADVQSEGASTDGGAFDIYLSTVYMSQKQGNRGITDLVMLSLVFQLSILFRGLLVLTHDMGASYQLLHAVWCIVGNWNFAGLLDRRLPVRLGPWERAPGFGVADRLERLLSEKDSRKVRSCNRHTTLQQCNSSFKDGRKIKSLFGILSMANSWI